MKNIIYISLLAIFLVACGPKNSEVEKIKVEIPEALRENAEAKELIEDMAEAVNSCRNNMAIGAQFAIEQEKSGSDSLTFKQGIKAAKFAAKMMFAAKKIEKIREKTQLLKPELSDAEWLALETKIDELETSVGDINPQDLGLTEDEIRVLKTKDEWSTEEDLIVLEDMEVEEQTTNQEDLESGMALREMEQELMQSANTNSETQQTETESDSNWKSIAFTLLIIVLVIFGIMRSVRVYKRKFRNASDTFSQVRNQFNKNK